MLLTYNPADLSDDHRTQMAHILKARAELQQASAEVAILRARVFSGDPDPSLPDLIDLKSANLLKLRQDSGHATMAFVKNSVDVDGLLEVLPTIGFLILQKFEAPLPVVLEAMGVDIDAIKLLVSELKKLASEI